MRASNGFQLAPLNSSNQMNTSNGFKGGNPNYGTSPLKSLNTKNMGMTNGFVKGGEPPFATSAFS